MDSGVIAAVVIIILLVVAFVLERKLAKERRDKALAETRRNMDEINKRLEAHTPGYKKAADDFNNAQSDAERVLRRLDNSGVRDVSDGGAASSGPVSLQGRGDADGATPGTDNGPQE